MTRHIEPGATPGFSPLGGDVDTTERLSADDMATRREAEFLGAALRRAQAASEGQAAPTGRCLWCDEACPPPARWCCAECREDHQQRQLLLRRQGRA